MAMFNPCHPGELLQEAIAALPQKKGQKRSIKQLAKDFDITDDYLNELLNCRMDVTPKIAYCLSEIFGNSVLFWTNAQKNYDVAQDRTKIDTKTTEI